MNKAKTYGVILLCLMFISCAVLEPRASYRKISDSRYAIKGSADPVFNDSTALYEKWEQKAKEACEGREFTVVDRELISRPGTFDQLVGVVECK